MVVVIAVTGFGAVYEVPALVVGGVVVEAYWGAEAGYHAYQNYQQSTATWQQNMNNAINKSCQ